MVRYILTLSDTIVNIQDNDGNSALMNACDVTSHTESYVKLLLCAGANLNLQNKHHDTALIKSCYSGNYVVSKLLIEQGACINVRGKNGTTALMYAAQDGNII